MTQNYVCFDNKFYNENQPIFQLNRAMKFGDGVFETIRVISGQPKYLDFHLERMQKGLKVLEINCSKGDIEVLKVCIDQLLIKNEIEEGGILRIIAMRGGLGKYTPINNQVHFYIEAEYIRENNYLLNKKGLTIDFSHKTMIYSNDFSSIKSLNALPYVLAAKEAVHRNFDELILLNNNKFIVETSSSNIFLVKNDVVYTPPIEDGCVAGVMRRVIINKLKSLTKRVVERSLKQEDLETAQEVFLTNCYHGIQWVGAYGKKRYFRKLTTQLITEI